MAPARPQNRRKPSVLARVFSEQDFLIYGRALAAFGKEENDDAMVALAWSLLNRWREGNGPVADLTLWAQEGLTDPLPPEKVRAFAALASVLEQSIADPTGGASRFHHHLEDPSWASEMQPQAVIGSYLFYGLKV